MATYPYYRPCIPSYHFRYGSVIAEFDLGTSTNNITDDDIKDAVNEQLTVMGMEPDPTETDTKCAYISRTIINPEWVHNGAEQWWGLVVTMA